MKKANRTLPLKKRFRLLPLLLWLCLLGACLQLSGCGKDAAGQNAPAAASQSGAIVVPEGSEAADPAAAPGTSEAPAPTGAQDSESAGTEPLGPDQPGPADPGAAETGDAAALPATLAQLTEQLGSEAVARAVLALWQQPSFRFSLDSTLDYTELFSTGKNQLTALDGEVQYAPFGLLDRYSYCSHADPESSVTSGEQLLSAFGTGELSCLFFHGSISSAASPAPAVEYEKSSLLLRYPDAGQKPAPPFPGADFCAEWAYRYPAAPNANLTLSMTAHKLVTCLLAGGTAFAEDGRGEIDGKSAVLWTGRFSGETLAWLTGVLNCPVDMSLLYSDPLLDEGAPVSLWIGEADGLPLRVETDFTELERRLYDEYWFSVYGEMRTENPDAEDQLYAAVSRDRNSLLQIGTLSFRLDLEPQAEGIRPPVALPDESERRILVNEWVLESVSYAALSPQPEPRIILLDPEGQDLSARLRAQVVSAAGSGADVTALTEDGTVLLLCRQGDRLLILSPAGEPFCRTGDAPVASYETLGSTSRFTYAGEAVSEAFEEAAREAIRKASGSSVSFTCDGADYRAQKTGKVKWEISLSGSVRYAGARPDEDFEAALSAAEEAGSTSFLWNGTAFARGLAEPGGGYAWYTADCAGQPTAAVTTLRAHPADPGVLSPDALLEAALRAAAAGETAFRLEIGAESADCRLVPLEDGWQITDAAGAELGQLLPWTVVRYSGADDLPLDIKLRLIGAARTMETGGTDRLEAEISFPDLASPDPDRPDRPIQDTARVTISRRLDASSDFFFEVAVEQYVYHSNVERSAHGG